MVHILGSTCDKNCDNVDDSDKDVLKMNEWMNDLFIDTFCSLELNCTCTYRSVTYIIRTLNSSIHVFYGYKLAKQSVLDGRVVNDQFEHVQ